MNNITHGDIHPTDVELRILGFLAQGYGSKEIAAAVNRSKSTIESHIRLLCARYHARSRAQLVARAIAAGHLFPAA